MTTYNLTQGVVDNLAKLSKIYFSVECFTAFGWSTGYLPSNSSISGIFLSFKVLNCSATRGTTRTFTW